MTSASSHILFFVRNLCHKFFRGDESVSLSLLHESPAELRAQPTIDAEFSYTRPASRDVASREEIAQWQSLHSALSKLSRGPLPPHRPKCTPYKWSEQHLTTASELVAPNLVFLHNALLFLVLVVIISARYHVAVSPPFVTSLS